MILKFLIANHGIKVSIMFKRKNKLSFVVAFLVALIMAAFPVSVIAASITDGVVGNVPSPQLGGYFWEVVMVGRDEDIYIYNAETGYMIHAAFYLDEDGNEIFIDLIEHAEFLNNRQDENLLPPNQYTSIDLKLPDQYISHYGVSPLSFNLRFIRTSTSIVSGASVRVSAEVRGPATISGASSVTSTQSFTAGLSAAGRNLITANAGFTWHNSSTSTTQPNMTWQIPANRIGAIHFTPRFNRVVGNLHTYCIMTGTRLSAQSVWGQSPRRVNGFTEGVFTLVTRAV